MKAVSLCCLLYFIILSAFSETIYVYTYEICNDEPVPCEFQVKEGILNGLFDAGHIVFDDISVSDRGNLLSGINIDKLIMDARSGGAYYFIGAQIISNLISLENKSECIESTAFYCLYDVSTGKLLKQGNTKMTNKENQLSKEILWFQLGLYISGEINYFYNKRE
ncbi:MAG: hypothetical protein JXB88_01755 [Spirochaetales bacterium]|nr:hypothetical protein [Spirochaetales bacterium]